MGLFQRLFGRRQKRAQRRLCDHSWETKDGLTVEFHDCIKTIGHKATKSGLRLHQCACSALDVVGQHVAASTSGFGIEVRTIDADTGTIPGSLDPNAV